MGVLPDRLNCCQFNHSNVSPLHHLRLTLLRTMWFTYYYA